MNTCKKSMLPFRAISGVLVALLIPPPAMAWGNTGHEAVAFVAWQQMNPTARANALLLLKLVPQLNLSKKVDGFTQWQQELPSGLSAADQSLFLFMRAATWPDSIKRAGLHDTDTPPPGKAVELPVGFDDKDSHGYWHFVDTGFSTDGFKPPSTPTPNAAVQIVELRKDLAAAKDMKLAAYELVWLEHLVGDIHQPLHAVTRFVDQVSDEGGNAVKVRLGALREKFLANLPQGVKGSAPEELHAFWDDLPGVPDAKDALKPAADFAKGLPSAKPGDVSETDPAKWATESFKMANTDAYRSPIGPGNTDTDGKSYLMTSQYYDKALQDAQGQIALAGARLAKMLNDIWPEKK
jgi:hypothetical protein